MAPPPPIPPRRGRWALTSRWRRGGGAGGKEPHPRHTGRARRGLTHNDGAGRQLVGIQLPRLPPLIGGFVGHAHLFGVRAQLHADRIPENHPKYNTYDSWSYPCAGSTLPRSPGPSRALVSGVSRSTGDTTCRAEMKRRPWLVKTVSACDPRYTWTASRTF